MGIKPTFSKDTIKKRCDAFLEVVEKQQIKRLQLLGEMCVREAREHGSYQDQTGNLRSSVGYTVFVDGVGIHDNFESVKGGTQGTIAGQALAAKVGKETTGVCLVVTAGMNYALYVEAKGYNVITSAEQLAKRELPQMLAKLVQNIKSASQE